MKSLLTVCLLFMFTIAPAMSQQNDVRTPADAKRDLTNKPQQIISLLNLQPGAKVLDLFAGDGYFSEVLAAKVGPGGQVILHNNQAYLGFVKDKLTERLARLKVPQLQRLDAEAEQLALQPNSLDAVLMSMVYHDFYYVEKDWQVTRAQVMPQLLSALKPGGQLLLIDHAAAAGSGTGAAQQLHRIEQSLVLKQLQEDGFELVAESPLLQNAADNHQLSAFDPKIRGNTDRFVLLFRKK